MEIQYLGETLLPGQIGKLCVIVAFAAALAATVAFSISAPKKDILLAQSWKQLGRIFFFVHATALAVVIASLFYILVNHLFEYHYAWQHSSLELPMKYILSAFWEGQEGSFLLWMFWNTVLGIVLIFRARELEAPVMAVFAVTQAFLGSMLLGIHIGDYKIGSNPFLLLRETMDAPLFARANYLEFIKDGNGLNPLLQNYWMTIHPPTLFLGFSSTLVPFAFAIASLWKKDFTLWSRYALPWSLFSTMILGAGILMGGAWAYEALTFGGFWAWDPVENSSLVPWITGVAGLHCLLIYRHTGRALKLTYVLFLITFVLVLYSTFLTRSGILGDTSVHAFTDLGMSGQLVIFMLFYVLLSAAMLLRSWKIIPVHKDEEKASSREFWLFIGALILTISAFQITFSTSIPVINKFIALLREIPLFSGFLQKDLAPPVDPAAHYNNIQVWVAIVITILTGAVQYLRYRNSDMRKVFMKLLLPAGIALPLSVVMVYLLKIYTIQYAVLLFAALFAITANMDYLFRVLKGKLQVGGASVAHAGFALILMGALISNYNQRVISINTEVDFGDALDPKSQRENILLRKNEPVRMHDYLVTYIGDSVAGPNNYYKVHYLRKDPKTDKVKEEFILYPNAQINPRMGLIANPDTRHYLTKDIYTHVTSVPDRKAAREQEIFVPDTLAIGDTFYIAKAYGILEGLIPNPPDNRYKPTQGDIAVGARLRFYTLDDRSYQAMPLYIISNRMVTTLEDSINELNAVFRIEKILPATEQIVIGVKQKNTENDFIILKAIIFPYINLLWLGCIMMTLGLLMSILRRYRDNMRIFSRQEY